MFKDITGQTFGRLTVLRRVENRRDCRAAWLCRCECGNECVVVGKELREGKTRSCGCLIKPPITSRDISGQQFGELTAQYPTTKRTEKGSVIWHCTCSCGNEVEVSLDALAWGRRISCGCRRQKAQKEIYQRLHYVDGTCIEALKRKKRSDNTSGYVGVYRRETGRYYAYIGFKGKRIHLGSFKTLEEAIAARENAKKQLHRQFLEEHTIKPQ